MTAPGEATRPSISPGRTTRPSSAAAAASETRATPRAAGSPCTNGGGVATPPRIRRQAAGAAAHRSPASASAQPRPYVLTRTMVVRNRERRLAAEAAAAAAEAEEKQKAAKREARIQHLERLGRMKYVSPTRRREMIESALAAEDAPSSRLSPASAWQACAATRIALQKCLQRAKLVPILRPRGVASPQAAAADTVVPASPLVGATPERRAGSARAAASSASPRHRLTSPHGRAGAGASAGSGASGGSGGGDGGGTQSAAAAQPCSICCEVPPATGRGKLHCGHEFCFSCITSWAKIHNVYVVRGGCPCLFHPALTPAALPFPSTGARHAGRGSRWCPQWRRMGPPRTTKSTWPCVPSVCSAAGCPAKPTSRVTTPSASSAS